MLLNAHISNKSISSGIFPDHLKLSIIKPTYKKGDRMNSTIYRPISLLTSFSKVFEKALYIRLTEHFNSNKLLVRRRGRRRKKLLDDLKVRTGYSHFTEEALDHTLWRNRFGGGFGHVVRQNTE